MAVVAAQEVAGDRPDPTHGRGVVVAAVAADAAHHLREGLGQEIAGDLAIGDATAEPPEDLRCQLAVQHLERPHVGARPHEELVLAAEGGHRKVTTLPSAAASGPVTSREEA